MHLLQIFCTKNLELVNILHIFAARYKHLVFNTVMSTLNESLCKSIVRRTEQRELLMDWLAEHPDFHIQVNFSVPNTSEHLCVGINHSVSQMLSKDVCRALDLQIKEMKSKL